MPIILAIEPDRRQAARLASVVRQRVGAELILAETTEGALDAIGNQIPDLVLVPTLLSPQDDAALAAALRVIATAAHVHTLTIPVLAGDSRHASPKGGRSWWRRGRGAAQATDGCDPAVFAEQITAYLREAAAERDSLEPLDSGEPSSFARAESPVAAVRRTLHVASAADAEVVAEFATGPGTDVAVEAMANVGPYAVAEVAFDADADADAEAEVALEAAIDVETDETGVATDLATDGEPDGVFEAEGEADADVVLEAAAEDVTDADADADEETDDDEIVIDLSDDVTEISQADADEELFAGERVGIYELPSVAIDDPLVAEFESPMERPFAAAAASMGHPVAGAADAFGEPVANELEQAIIDEFSIEAFVPEEVTSDRFDAEAWISMDLRFGRMWPPLKGMLADASSPRDTATREEAPVAAAMREEAPAPVAAAPPRRNERAEWSELVASLRQDLERRRGEPAAAPVAQRPSRRSTKSKPVQDEWGFFDPEQCGFAALLAKLDEVTESAEELASRRPS